MTFINLTTAAGKTKPAPAATMRVDIVANMKRRYGQEKAAPVGTMAANINLTAATGKTKPAQSLRVDIVANMQKLLDKRGTDR